MAHRLRRHWVTGIHCPNEVVFAIAISAVWALLYNDVFWDRTFAAMWQPSGDAGFFLAALCLLVVTLQATAILLLPGRKLMRAVVGAFFIIASVGSYFTEAYGAIMDKDMLRNVFATEPAEIEGLLGPALLAHLVLFGIVPAILVWRVRLPATGVLHRVKQRGLFLAVAWGLCAAALFATSANFAVFLRANKPIRFTLSPLAPVSSAAGLVADTRKHRHAGPLIDPGGKATRVGAIQTRPLVMFVVIGETARAANFELGGYARPTNPRLAQLPGVMYFDRATSCGTSTAISVPCMFSPLGRQNFDVNAAGDYVNLLDTLAGAGFDVEWRDNNAGCKGVCVRVPTTNYSGQTDAGLCVHSYCFDEILLEGLKERLQRVTRDTVIVFHQIGSHGPAYFERYPPRFEIFTPACRSNELQRCTREEIVNAYDNSIAYSDYVLSRQMELLDGEDSRIDALLVYVSDHGESLGEHGLYLHGLPYAFAPAVQREVPMLFWTSASFRRRTGVEEECLRGRAHDAVSHDNFYHTLLGAAELRDRIYDPRLDLLAPCRHHAGGPMAVTVY